MAVCLPDDKDGLNQILHWEIYSKFSTQFLPKFFGISDGLMNGFIRLSVEVSGTDDWFSGSKSENDFFKPESMFWKPGPSRLWCSQQPPYSTKIRTFVNLVMPKAARTKTNKKRLKNQGLGKWQGLLLFTVINQSFIKTPKSNLLMYPMRSLACSFLMTAIRGPFLAFRWVVETANSKPVDLDWRATDKAT